MSCVYGNKPVPPHCPNGPEGLSSGAGSIRGGVFASGRINRHTEIMVQKLAVSLDKRTVGDLDRWVREGRYPNRSRAVQAAVDLLTEREKRSRLARELSKLNRRDEQQMADEGLGDSSWPAF